MAVCGYFRDKVMRMYDVANAGRSGTALCVLPQKSLTPKIFHLSVSHRKFIANNGVYGCRIGLKTLDLTVSHQIIIANNSVYLL